VSTLNVLEILNIFGLFVFAISGALRALRQDMDFFGVALLAFVTGVGGGTIRDVLLGFFPVWWIENISAVFICLAGAIVATLAQSVLDSRIKALIWADALGLSAFAILGAQSALGAGAHPVIAIFMGAVTATFGGVVRDVLLNEPPLILKQDIYATAAMLGAAAYIGLLELGVAAAAAAPLAALITSLIRGASILFNIPSPKFGHPPRQ